MRFGRPGSSQHPRFYFFPLLPTTQNILFFFLGRIEFGRWCMDPNDRLWIENSLVLTLSVNSCCLSGGVYRVYDTDSGVDILVIVALAGIMYDGLTSRGTGRGGKERYSV